MLILDLNHKGTLLPPSSSIARVPTYTSARGLKDFHLAPTNNQVRVRSTKQIELNQTNALNPTDFFFAPRAHGDFLADSCT